jgi:uncharacterized protein YgiM (DUF1202 family)
MTALLEHPLANPRITQRFGLRESVYGADGHMGVDYGCVTGTPIWSVADGIVDKSGTDPGGYGEYVRIWHPALNIYTLYGHFSQRKVKVGDTVKQGDTIGLSGNTGNSTGPHLHYEIRLATGKDQWVAVPGMRYSQVDPFAFRHGWLRGVPAEPVKSGTVTVTDDNCNVRSGPGTTYSKVGVVNTGATGTASARNAAGDWVKLVVNGIDGWMAAFLITVEGGVTALPVYEEPVRDDFDRAMQFVERWEGGYVNHPSDPGGATNRGITIGTLTRWRVAKGLPAATVADVKALTREEANAIYKAWYWEASGADRMDWPMCLAHFDLAVNGGVGRAKAALAAVGPDFDKYLTWRENWYRSLQGFPTFGTGWLRRCADLRKEAAK